MEIASEGQNVIRVCGVPYLATLEREGRGCKIAVDGYCFGQRLSTAIFHFKSYKIIENHSKNELTLNHCLLVFKKILASSILASLNQLVHAQQEVEASCRTSFGGRGRKKGKRKKEGRKKTDGYETASLKIEILILKSKLINY